MNKFSPAAITRLLSGPILGALMLALSGAPALATTPDGETPANEGVCDTLKTGASPGLYGLCVAYCEAQDLDSVDKEPPSTKILDNYNRKKQAGDPDMPCLKVPCPCWTDAELASISADNAAGACVRGTNTIQIIDNTPRLHLADANTTVGRERCRYIDANQASPVVRIFTISAPEAQSCYTAVSSACTALGL